MLVEEELQRIHAVRREYVFSGYGTRYHRKIQPGDLRYVFEYHRPYEGAIAGGEKIVLYLHYGLGYDGECVGPQLSKPYESGGFLALAADECSCRRQRGR